MSAFLSQPLYPPISHLWKGLSASVPQPAKSGFEDQFSSTLNIYYIIIYFKWEAFGFFPLGINMIKSAILCPGEEVTELKFSTKIASQGETCFLVTNSAVMFSDTCFRFLIGSAGIISLLSVFDQTDIINHTCSKFSSCFDSPGCPQSMGDKPACSATWIPTPQISSWHVTPGYSLSQFPTFENSLWMLRLYQNIENSRRFWIILYEET